MKAVLHPRSNRFKRLSYNRFHVVNNVIYLTVADTISLGQREEHYLAIPLCMGHFRIVTKQVAIAVVVQFYTCFFQLLKQFFVKFDNFCTYNYLKINIFYYICNLLPSDNKNKPPLWESEDLGVPGLSARVVVLYNRKVRELISAEAGDLLFSPDEFNWFQDSGGNNLHRECGAGHRKRPTQL